MAKAVEPMTSGSISKRMIFFALPLLLGNLFQQLYNTVDSLIVGNFLGSSAPVSYTHLDVYKRQLRGGMRHLRMPCRL